MLPHSEVQEPRIQHCHETMEQMTACSDTTISMSFSLWIHSLQQIKQGSHHAGTNAASYLLWTKGLYMWHQ